MPHEPAADGPAHLELVPDGQIPDKVGRDLAVGQFLDGDLKAVRRQCPRHGVGPHGGVPVRGGQPDVDVLAGDACHRRGELEADGPSRFCFRPDRDHLCGSPRAAHQ